MTLAHPLSPPLVDRIAQRFRVLGEPMRIRLLDHLRDGESSVQELTSSLGTTQQNVSKHLAVLHSEGVISKRRDGTRVLHAIADESVFEICEQVCGGLRRQTSELEQLLAGASR
jgi:DNA-binding transcriptional ArsR family regulator